MEGVSLKAVTNRDEKPTVDVLYLRGFSSSCDLLSGGAHNLDPNPGPCFSEMIPRRGTLQESEDNPTAYVLSVICKSPTFWTFPFQCPESSSLTLLGSLLRSFIVVIAKPSGIKEKHVLIYSPP